MVPGLIIAAPASGSGKTTLTLGLLRHLRDQGVAVASLKIGPDYIDPAFHAAAGGRPCRNLDLWAMRGPTLAAVIDATMAGAELVIAEGVMGLFDGAPDGSGSTADAALATGWPVVLVVDVRGQAASAAAVIHGFKTFRPEVPVAAVLFNRVGGEGHVRTLKQASAGLGLPILGFVPRSEDCVLPSRHLGLVQAEEHPELEAFLTRTAALVGRHVDIAALKALARPAAFAATTGASSLPPLGQRIAVARDAAFAFSYPHLLDGWRTAGAEIHPFSPLADESPAADADAIYLPGGYPELHAGRLASNDRFLDGLRRMAGRGVTVYGECGGYMVLGRVLIDAEGQPHPMAGLLPVDTSFAERRLHLGYRAMRTLGATPLGPAGAAFRGHEFHFARLLKEDGAPPLFQCRDAVGTELGTAGAISGSVAGSFLHVIDTADDKPL